MDQYEMTEVTLTDGRVVAVEVYSLKDFRGLDEFGHHVYSGWVQKDGTEYLYPVTDCCHASATFSDSDLCCKACWNEVDFYFGGSATVAVAVAR